MLLFDEIAEIFSLVVETKLPSQCFKNMIYLLHEDKNDTQNNQVEKGKLNNKEEEIHKNYQH